MRKREPDSAPLKLSKVVNLPGRAKPVFALKKHSKAGAELSGVVEDSVRTKNPLGTWEILLCAYIGNWI